jgi:hypothetical protein
LAGIYKGSDLSYVKPIIKSGDPVVVVNTFPSVNLEMFVSDGKVAIVGNLNFPEEGLLSDRVKHMSERFSAPSGIHPTDQQNYRENKLVEMIIKDGELNDYIQTFGYITLEDIGAVKQSINYSPSITFGVVESSGIVNCSGFAKNIIQFRGKEYFFDNVTINNPEYLVKNKLCYQIKSVVYIIVGESNIKEKFVNTRWAPVIDVLFQ